MIQDILINNLCKIYPTYNKDRVIKALNSDSMAGRILRMQIIMMEEAYELGRVSTTKENGISDIEEGERVVLTPGKTVL